jgi:serine/threonine-protein kinase
MSSTISKYLDENAPLPVGQLRPFLSALAKAFAELHAEGKVWTLHEQDMEVSAPDSIAISRGISPIREPIVRAEIDLTEVGLREVDPPELLESGLRDERTDVFALGALGYTAIVGKSPFQHSTVIETMNAMMKGEFVSPTAVRPECPVSLERFIVKALARNPADRFQTLKECLVQLDEMEL